MTASVLADPLYPLSNVDQWTVGDAVEGTWIVGATGSGKTSASGSALARAFLRAGFGGLVLCAKKDELDTWKRHAEATGRTGDLVVFGPGESHRFNVLDYEFTRPGEGAHLTRNIVELLLTATSASGGGDRGSSDPYWEEALRELLTHATDLAAAATGRVELPVLARLIRSAPLRPWEIADPGWQRESHCWALIQMLEAKRDALRAASTDAFEDLQETIAFWLSDFPRLADRTRSVVVSSFTARVSGLLRHPLRALLCTRTDPEVMPDRTHEGKIIILNLPIKEYGQVGRFAQLLYKTVWQGATERRSLTGDWRPVFLWADESQYFLTPADVLFQQTARSAVAATVYLTQNLPCYYAALGGRDAEASTNSIVGLLQTKIFHANGDPTTNSWAEQLFAQADSSRRAMNVPLTTGGQGMSGTFQDTRESVIPAIRFTMLRKASDPKGAQAIVFQAGRRWKGTGSNHLTVDFPRLPPTASGQA